MRLAIVSDVHGNLTALEAVVRDLRDASPDAVLHGGDLVTHGHRPAEVLDRVRERVSLLHASPGNLWRAPMPDADDEVLRETYEHLGGRVVVCGHIHRPFVRRLPDGVTVANTGSVGLSFDGDRRASYLVIEDESA